MTYNVFGGTSNLALSIYLVDSYSPTVDLMYRKSVKFILTKSPCTAHRVPLCAWWIETTPTPSTLRRAPPSHFWSSSIKFILKGSAVDQSSSSAHLSGHTVGWLVDATRESGVDIEHVDWPQRGVVYTIDQVHADHDGDRILVRHYWRGPSCSCLMTIFTTTFCVLL